MHVVALALELSCYSAVNTGSGQAQTREPGIAASVALTVDFLPL